MDVRLNNIHFKGKYQTTYPNIMDAKISQVHRGLYKSTLEWQFYKVLQ